MRPVLPINSMFVVEQAGLSSNNSVCGLYENVDDLMDALEEDIGPGLNNMRSIDDRMEALEELDEQYVISIVRPGGPLINPEMHDSWLPSDLFA